MLRESVTVTFGEGNSAVKVAMEYGNFDCKLQTKPAGVLLLTICYTQSSYKIPFDCSRYMNVLTSATVTQYSAVGNIGVDETR